jgi:SPP1 gp7 family putative phage head morphogenesis protein
MRYDLAAMFARKKPRRRSITFRPILPPSTLASDLYAAGYEPVIAVWIKALPDILRAYEQALSEVTRDSPATIGTSLEGVDRELPRILINIRLRLESWALKVEKWQRTKWKGAVLTATGIDVGTMIGPGDMKVPVATAIERNVGLVKSVGEQARTRIGEAVFRGLNQRRPAADVSKDIRTAVDMGRRRARNIASDQLTKLSSQLASERRREAGIDTWQWVSSHKVHYRPEHQARDGKRYADDDPPADLPGELINCGCTERAVLSLDGEF